MEEVGVISRSWNWHVRSKVFITDTTALQQQVMLDAFLYLYCLNRMVGGFGREAEQTKVGLHGLCVGLTSGFLWRRFSAHLRPDVRHRFFRSDVTHDSGWFHSIFMLWTWFGRICSGDYMSLIECADLQEMLVTWLDGRHFLLGSDQESHLLELWAWSQFQMGPSMSPCLIHSNALLWKTISWRFRAVIPSHSTVSIV